MITDAIANVSLAASFDPEQAIIRDPAKGTTVTVTAAIEPESAEMSLSSRVRKTWLGRSRHAVLPFTLEMPPYRLPSLRTMAFSV